MPQKRSQILFWSAYSKVYDGLLNLKPYARLIADATDRLKLRDGAVVADLGCGTGNCIDEVLRKNPDRAMHVTGIDSSPQMLRAAARKLGDRPGVELVESSLLDWIEEQPAGSIDNIISVNVLYTMRAADRERFWAGVANALRVDGNAVVVTTDRPGIGPVAREHLSQTPIWRSLSPRLFAVLVLNMVIWLFESNSTYDPASLETLVEEAAAAGLRVTETRRCYGGEVDGVDVLLVLGSSAEAVSEVA